MEKREREREREREGEDSTHQRQKTAQWREREREELRGGETSLRAGARSRAEHKRLALLPFDYQGEQSHQRVSLYRYTTHRIQHAIAPPGQPLRRPSPSAACTRRAHREAAADDSRTGAVPGRGTDTPPSQHRRASVASPGQHRQRQRERRQRRTLHGTNQASTLSLPR